MVKSGKRKFVKKEKAKVHLKVSHKTLLPKGQNVTDTNFKVRKIVLHGQLKERGEHEILSKGNLNIKVRNYISETFNQNHTYSLCF